jgi:hypothetical protein
MVVKPGVAFVSDIAVHHAEVILGGGTRTLAALSNLAETCQAAVPNDTLAVSRLAWRGSTWLQQLDFVKIPHVEMVPAEDESPREAATSDGILGDQDEDGSWRPIIPKGVSFSPAWPALSSTRVRCCGD